MPKPDPALLDPARYPFTGEIATRFSDLDTNLHINNVALAGICEDSRVRFHKACGYHAALHASGPGTTAMVVSFAIEYLGQAFHPAPIHTHVAAETIGGSSYVIAQLLRQDGRTVAFARSTMVVVQGGRAIAIPDQFRTSVQPWMLAA